MTATNSTGAAADSVLGSRRAWTILGIAMLAYAVAVFQRSSLGVVEIEAQRRFATTAAVMSLFSVLQLAVYAGLQIPVGMLVDRVGSRRLLTMGAALMGAGQLLLAQSHTVGLGLSARVLLGAGDALAFISVLRLIPMWFPARRIPLLTQMLTAFGLLGQLAATYPLVILLRATGWTTSFTTAAVISLVMCVLAAVGIRNAPPGTPLPQALGPAEVVRRLKLAWHEPGTRLGLSTHFGAQFPATVFAMLWGYPFLVSGEGLSPTTAGALLTVLVLGAAPVAPLVGLIAMRWPHRRSTPTLTIICSTAAVWAAVLLWPGRAPIWLLLLLVAVMSSNGPGAVMGFDYARTENEPARIGSASGIVNVGGFTASLGAIGLIGIVLSLQSSPALHTYTLSELKLAMFVQYIFWAIGIAGILHYRRKTRAARGLHLEPLQRVLLRRWRRRAS